MQSYRDIGQLQTQLCKSTKVMDAANSTVQNYKGCNLNCAILQGYWMLQTQLCKSTKVMDAANSTVQTYKGPGCCNLNCAKSPFQLVWTWIHQLCRSTKVVGYSPLIIVSMHAGYQCLYFCAAELAVIQYPCRIAQLRLQHAQPLYFCTVEFAVSTTFVLLYS